MKYYRSTNVERGKGFCDVPLIEGKTTLEEGGDVYFPSSRKHVYHHVWLVESDDYFHMTTTHME
jgi:hypothetical protein